MTKMHVHNNPLFCLQLGILEDIVGVKVRNGKGCARGVSLAQLSCVMM